MSTTRRKRRELKVPIDLQASPQVKTFIRARRAGRRVTRRGECSLLSQKEKSITAYTPAPLNSSVHRSVNCRLPTWQREIEPATGATPNWPYALRLKVSGDVGPGAKSWSGGRKVKRRKTASIAIGGEYLESEVAAIATLPAHAR